MTVSPILALPSNQTKTTPLTSTNGVVKTGSWAKFNRLVKKSSQSNNGEKVKKEEKNNKSTSLQQIILSQLQKLLSQAESQEESSHEDKALNEYGLKVTTSDLKEMMAFLKTQNNGDGQEDNKLLSKLTDILTSSEDKTSSKTLTEEISSLLKQANTALNTAAEKSEDVRKGLSKSQIKNLASILNGQKDNLLKVISSQNLQESDERSQQELRLNDMPALKGNSQEQIEASVTVEKSHALSQGANISSQEALSTSDMPLNLASLTAEQENSDQDQSGSHHSFATDGVSSSEKRSEAKEDVNNFAMFLSQEKHNSVEHGFEQKEQAAQDNEISAPSGEGVAALSPEALSKKELSLNIQTADKDNVHVLVKNTQEGINVSLQAQNDQTTEALQKTHQTLSQDIQHINATHLETHVTVLPTDTQNSTSDQSLNQNSFFQQGESYGQNSDRQRGNTQSSFSSYNHDEPRNQIESVTPSAQSAGLTGQDGSRLNISV